VKVISVERDGKVRLSRRELMPFPEGEEGDRARERIQRAREAGAGGGRGGPRGGGGGRDRDRGRGGGRDRERRN